MSQSGGGGRGGDTYSAVVKHRFLVFIIWQSIISTAIFLLSKALIFSLFTSNPLSPSLSGLSAFLLFNSSVLLFSAALSTVSAPQPSPADTPFDIYLSLLYLVFVPSTGRPLPTDFRRRLRVSLGSILFVATSGMLGFVSIVAVCWSCDAFDGLRPWRLLLGTVGFRGFVVGFAYGLYYMYKRRWVLEFPIIQRPVFFSFKMGLPSAVGQALKLSSAGYLLSAVMVFFLPNEFKNKVTIVKFIAEQIVFYFGTFIVFLCWELSHHLQQVLHTKRFIFAPPKGSAAAETNPSEPLIAALEESMPGSLLQYLAYLDLCMVCERNADTWRRAAFFEETKETYKRVIAVCIKPLEQFTVKLGECLESYSVENSIQLSHQLHSLTDSLADSRVHELFYDVQLLEWCAQVAASLTVHSRKEDRFGVAQLSGGNAAVVSILVSCLLAVEMLMGKKTNLQSSNYLMGPASIKWGTLNSGRKDLTFYSNARRKGSPIYMKAYAMADILRTSLYNVIYAFYDEMLNGDKAGLLEKDWIVSCKPLYGTRELLSQKLLLFLDFKAN